MKNRFKVLLGLVVILMACVALFVTGVTPSDAATFISQLNGQDVAVFVFGAQGIGHAIVFGPMIHTGKDNMGGYKSRLVFIPDGLVSAVPTLPTTLAAIADYATATGAFTFINGAVPIAIQATDKTVKIAAEPQGEIDGQSFKQTGEFLYPGDEVAAAAFARMVNSTPGYVVVENAKGEQFMTGQKGLFCYIKPAFDGGAGRGDKKGFKFTFESDSVAPFIKLASPIDINALFV
jgi:hypothetical protein